MSEANDKARTDAMQMMGSDCLFLVVPLQRVGGEFVSPISGIRVTEGARASTSDIILTLGLANAALDSLMNQVLLGMKAISGLSSEELCGRLACAMDMAEQMLESSGKDESLTQYFQVRHHGGRG